jgi:hypothetical protein
LKYYKDDGKENICENKPIEVTLEKALKEVDNSPTTEGNYIGFTNEKDETIQFIRFEENGWIIDVPVTKKGKLAYSLQDDNLTTEKVKDIVKKFFSGENWQSLCNLKKSSD